MVDLLREQGLSPTVALFTGSDKLTAHGNNVISVGKAWMVSRLQTLLHARRLHLPQTPEARVLARELTDYAINVNERSHASFNARSNSHDDLVIALGLSVGVGGEMQSVDYLAPTVPDSARHGGQPLEVAVDWNVGVVNVHLRRAEPQLSATVGQP